ncbi:hypothetical protein PSMA108079_11730 [Pseudoalteromonas mariniglutinosa]
MPALTPNVVPLIVGVVSLLCASALIVIIGAVVSIKPTSVALAVLPALSATVAVTVNSPSTSVPVTSVDQLPPAVTVAVKVCVAPLLATTVIDTSVPMATPFTDPVNVGVTSLVSAITSIAMIGAVKSMVAVACALPSFPASSTTLAWTL